ncbi:hypothetical protein RDV89_19350 [Nocardioides zeae]|uniref:Uncharacterized protein n=1 Tax=Nocardioides imazamoxiresistens TaxID=3231893 RepID=A0ABU3Q163_9ACTN|nr:hypothetical protein [Nocardioides zeae]MDT9595252.1 hypothetical protein [Nocardioides zeae]
MNYDNPLAALFPGAAGRTVAELARRHREGASDVAISEVAASAAVVPDQLRRVLTRLALLGLVDFPGAERVRIEREHLAWPALAALDGLSAAGGPLDALVAAAAGSVGARRVVLDGPVPGGTAAVYSDATELALVGAGPLTKSARQGVAAAVSRATGNACIVTTADAEPAGVPSSARVLEVDVP